MTEGKKLLDHWLPPEGAGRPIACVATTFTFEPDFFEGDCLGRFLNLDTKRGEGSDLAHVIEEEERLEEARVTLIVDRSIQPENRNLRWDLLTVAVPRRGLMHAKVAVLAWENLVRFIVSSANLTPAGYRSQLEAAVGLDASLDSEIDPAVFLSILDLLVDLTGRAPGSPGEQGPKRRTLEALDRVRELVGVLTAGRRAGSSRMRLAVAPEALGGPVLPAVSRVWSGGPARDAWILSPYYDPASEGVQATLGALGACMAQRGSRTVTFVVPVETLASGGLARAPRSLSLAGPGRVTVSFAELDQSKVDERRVHAKVLLLESDFWIAALIGSSNFSSAGLGIASTAHLELNVAVGAPIPSPEAEALRELIPVGDELLPEDVDWEMPPDEEETDLVPLPEGFAECLVDPPPEAVLLLRLHEDALPPLWTIALPSGQVLLDSSAWIEQGRQSQVRLPLADARLPFWLQVTWTSAGSERSAGWPVNVTEPAKLPAPEELRDLPVDAVLEALASTRPLHEAVVAAIRRAEARMRVESVDPDLNPLRRYSNSGFLLHRVRMFSAALVGLRKRLERPAASLDTLEWRLTSRFGPLEIARSIAKEAKEDGRPMAEASFLLAELALTLSRVDWGATGRMLPEGAVRARVASLIDQIEQLASSLEGDDPVSSYVRAALAEARR